MRRDCSKLRNRGRRENATSSALNNAEKSISNAKVVLCDYNLLRDEWVLNYGAFTIWRLIGISSLLTRLLMVVDIGCEFVG